MKRYYKILSLVAIIATTAFSACVKQDATFDENNTGGILEISSLPSRANSTAYSVLNKTFDAVSSASLPITINYTGVDGAPQDITVTMAIDATALTTYNTAQSTNYTLLPTTLYSASTYTLTIPKGQKTATLNLALNTAAFDFSLSYALPISIKSATAGIISSNYGTGIVAIAVKNKWDGIYTVNEGTMVDVTSSTLTHINNYLAAAGKGKMQYSLVTISATKCAVYDDKFAYSGGGYLSPITTGGTGLSNYGSFSAVFEFDATTNKVIGVTNYQGQPAANTRSGRLDPTGINTYDPATKTISIKYNMLQPSVVAAAPYVRTTWTEVMTYKSARP